MHLLLPFFIYCIENLDVKYDVKQRIDDCLKVEKVCVAAESIDPSDPHEQGVLN